MALFWPYTEQFSPSQISFHHSKKCCNITVWRFCLWNMKKWKAMPLGLIVFLLFNKYLGIGSVLESKRYLTYAGHVAAHTGNFSPLSWLHAQCSRLIHTLHLRIALTRIAGKKDAGCFSQCKFFRLTRIITGEDNWQNPFLAVAYYIIFFVHEKKHLLREINSSSSVFRMH